MRSILGTGQLSGAMLRRRPFVVRLRRRPRERAWPWRDAPSGLRTAQAATAGGRAAVVRLVDSARQSVPDRLEASRNAAGRAAEAALAAIPPRVETAKDIVREPSGVVRGAVGGIDPSGIVRAAVRRTGATGAALAAAGSTGAAAEVARDEDPARVISTGAAAQAAAPNGRAETQSARSRTGDPDLRLASGPGPLRLRLGLVAAQTAFAATFRGPRPRFWQRMTMTGMALGGYALVASPAARRTRVRRRDVALGLGSAAVLYATFQAGDRFARRVVPTGARDIAEIYSLRELRPAPEIALRLATVIGPAEELFWRGLVQESLMARHGRWRGAALAALAYAGVHLVTGNVTLVGAAGVAGAHWCALYAAGMPIGALVVSHVTWDVWIFLLQPTT